VGETGTENPVQPHRARGYSDWLLDSREPDKNPFAADGSVTPQQLGKVNDMRKLFQCGISLEGSAESSKIVKNRPRFSAIE